jgi:hypothetical protein
MNFVSKRLNNCVEENITKNKSCTRKILRNTFLSMLPVPYASKNAGHQKQTRSHLVVAGQF